MSCLDTLIQIQLLLRLIAYKTVFGMNTKQNSNTTLVKVNHRQTINSSNTVFIQIQLLLRLIAQIKKQVPRQIEFKYNSC